MSDRRNGRRDEVRPTIADRSEYMERLLLGNILTNPDLFYECMDSLTVDHFTIARHMRVWDSLQRIVVSGKVPSKGLLRMFVDVKDNEEQTPLQMFIAMVVNEAQQAAGDTDFESALQAVRSLGNRRMVIAELQKTMQRLQTADPDTPIETLIDHATRALNGVAVGGIDRDLKTYEEWGNQLTDRLDRAMKSETALGLSPGLVGVEEVMGRLLPGKLYIIGGMSGVGKSALIRQICEAASMDAVSKGLGYGYMLSLEMTGEENAARALSSFLNIPSHSIETADIQPAEFDRIINQGMAHLSRMPIMVDQRTRLGMDEIRNRMRKAKNRKGLSLAVIDHLLLIKHGPRDTLNDRIASATGEAKNLAKEFDIPVICLSQVNEEKVMMMPSLEPTTGHLFGGQASVQNSDFVGFIHRPEEALRKKGPSTSRQEDIANHQARLMALQGQAFFYNGKSRGRGNGKRRELFFMGETTSFKDVAQ